MAIQIVYGKPGQFSTSVTIGGSDLIQQAGHSTGQPSGADEPAQSPAGAAQSFELGGLPVAVRWHCGFCENPLAACICYPNPAPSDPIPVEFTAGAGAGGHSTEAAPAYFYCVDCPTCAGWGRVPESGYASAPFDRPCPTCWGL